MKRLLILLLALATPLLAQKKLLTYESIYEPAQKVQFGGSIQRDFEWVDDTTFIWPRRDNEDFLEWRMSDVATGKERPIFSRAKLAHALMGSGLSQDVAKDVANGEDVEFDATNTALVVSANEDLYLYSIGKNTVTRLTSAPGEEELPTFSPDGQQVAFIRANDLYVVDLSGAERRLTTDGSKDLLNGKLDYVYQEEVYGRGNWKGFWWSPDSRRIVFLQLDERPVPEFTVVDHIPYRLDLNVYDYPKAGDPNPLAKLFIVPASGGPRVEIDTARTGGEILIVNVHWSKTALTYQLQNREQSWLELVRVNPDDGSAKPILRETTKAWVDPLGTPVWLPDGGFLWQSERSGYRHVYHYGADGALVRQVTNGEWEVRDLHGADGQYVYFSGTERSPIGLDVYRVKLDGTGLTRISDPAGKHTAVFNPSMTHYVDKWSDISTPDQIRLHRNDGTAVRIVEENKVAALAEYDLPKPEFLQVKTRDGFPMEAMLIRPPNFDPKKKYPVYQFTYAGPGAQQVRNEWRGHFMLFNQLIAQQGALVWIVDNRSASGKGAVSRWPVYKNFGESELRDLEDSLTWLKAQPYVDGSRVMLNGWSYGGFMVLYAMTHSKSWSSGIAGGPVADWRDYDSIYTERYMLMPQNNPDGYRKSSPRFDLANLHGNLLLLHGTTDDNVHVQNTVQVAYELQELNRSFEMMLLPRAKHTVVKKPLTFMQKVILEFVRRQLLAAGSQSSRP